MTYCYPHHYDTPGNEECPGCALDERDDLIRALAGRCDLTDDQERLLNQICSD